MGYLAQFKIPFAGLGLGEHSYKYIIDNQFFKQFEHSVVQNGNLQVDLLLKRQETMLLLEFDISGELAVICDLCAGEFMMPVSGKENLIIKLGDKALELSENLMMIDRKEHEINISQYLYELISLLLPQRIVHPEDKSGKSACDQQTLQAMRALSNKPHETDPRWEALKKIKLK